MISIIIPVFNGEKYIEKCLESITNQTFTDLEIIIINDESTDKTEKICTEYIKKDKRIKMITQKNTGPEKARENGVSICNGEQVMFIDSDDFLQLDIVENAYNKMIESNADIVCFNYEICGKRGFNLIEEVIDRKTAIINIMTQKKLDGNLPYKLYNKDLFSGTRMCRQRNGDFITVASIIEKANYIAIIPDVGYHYRKVENSRSRNIKCNKNEEEYEKITKEFIKKILAIFPELTEETNYFYLKVILYICIRMEKDLLFDRKNPRFVKIKTLLRLNGKEFFVNKFFKKREMFDFILVYCNLFRPIYKIILLFKARKNNEKI